MAVEYRRFDRQQCAQTRQPTNGFQRQLIVPKPLFTFLDWLGLPPLFFIIPDGGYKTNEAPPQTDEAWYGGRWAPPLPDVVV